MKLPYIWQLIVQQNTDLSTCSQFTHNEMFLIFSENNSFMIHINFDLAIDICQ